MSRPPEGRHRLGSDLSSSAQEYLLTLRIMAGDGARVTASQVARKLGVSTQAASEMFKRLGADGLVSLSEGRELLLDEARLTEMAALSEGGRYLHVADLPSLRPPTRSVAVPTDRHDDEIWDDLRVLVLATCLLAAEWLLRKRWHLV